jgi:GH25 family lysozyme M1 (1,4-beta-N-acetylmuramidase)
MRYDLTISSGSTGRIVQRMQAELVRRGEDLTVDGKCGPRTMGAVARALCLPSPKAIGLVELARLGIDVRLGIDLSGHNEGGNKRPVNFDKVKAAGVSFVWLKLSEGASYRNHEAMRQADECQRLDLPVGGYHFGDPSAKRPLDLASLKADAVAEADHYLEWRRSVIGAPTLSDVLDLEEAYQANLTAAAWAAIGGTSRRRAELCALWCLTWLEHVERATGRTPMLYTGRWAWQGYLAAAPAELLERLRRHGLWLASYNTGSEPKRTIAGYPWRVWQFSGSGSVDGVDGKVDLNWAFAEDLAP